MPDFELLRVSTSTMLPESEAAREVVDAAFKIHKAWGPGLLESAYAVALEHELKKRGRRVVRQPAVDIVWEDLHLIPLRLCAFA